MKASENKTVQQKMIELGTLVAWFDSDEFELEKALDMFRQAEKLAEEIEHDLGNLKNEIRLVKQKFDTDIA